MTGSTTSSTPREGCRSPSTFRISPKLVAVPSCALAGAYSMTRRACTTTPLSASKCSTRDSRPSRRASNHSWAPWPSRLSRHRRGNLVISGPFLACMCQGLLRMEVVTSKNNLRRDNPTRAISSTSSTRKRMMICRSSRNRMHNLCLKSSHSVLTRI